MKQKKLVIGGICVVAAVAIAVGGTFAYKHYQEQQVKEQTAKIVDDVGQDQVDGNLSMLIGFLKSEGVSEDKAESKATDLMNLLYSEAKVGDIDGIGPGTKENTYYVESGANMLYVVTYENSGDKISFKSVKEGSQNDYVKAGMMESSTVDESTTELTTDSTESTEESTTEESGETATEAGVPETTENTESVE